MSFADSRNYCSQAHREFPAPPRRSGANDSGSLSREISRVFASVADLSASFGELTSLQITWVRFLVVLVA
jgi:hypothetical protein